VEICATRTKEEEMVQELMKDWQKRAHRYIKGRQCYPTGVGKY
jgi:hypothetical protein